MKISNSTIEKVVLNVMHTGGWLPVVEKAFGKEAADYAEKFHDEFIQMLERESKFYYQVELPKVRKKIQEFREENKEFAEECQRNRKKELQEELDLLEIGLESEIKLCNERDKLEELKESDRWRRAEYLEKQLRGNISDVMIERARGYPIENIVEVNQSGFALCVIPEHSEKNPSMFCRKNYAHCFSCGFTGDTIGVMMNVRGVSFPEAVRLLQ